MVRFFSGICVVEYLMSLSEFLVFFLYGIYTIADVFAHLESLEITSISSSSLIICSQVSNKSLPFTVDKDMKVN